MNPDIFKSLSTEMPLSERPKKGSVLNLTFCCCDAAAIRTLPFLGLSDRGISVEKLLKISGFTRSDLQDKHTDKYFKDNLAIGKQNKTYYFSRKQSELTVERKTVFEK